MEIMAAMKMSESSMTMVCDKINAMGGKLEDLLFRAQRIAAAQKNKVANNDSMFGYDLQHFRNEVRTFSAEIGGLPNLVGSIERTAEYNEAAVKPAQSLMRICERLAKSLKTLSDQAYLAHQHIREANHKVEAWYLAQEVEQMAQKAQGLPTVANKIVIRVSTPGTTA